MGRKKSNRSEAVRSAISQHPNAKPAKIVEILAEQGVKVTAQLVSNVKTRLRKDPAAAPGSPHSKDLVSIESLVGASQFARRAGGVKAARNLLETLLRLSIR